MTSGISGATPLARSTLAASKNGVVDRVTIVAPSICRRRPARGWVAGEGDDQHDHAAPSSISRTCRCTSTWADRSFSWCTWIASAGTYSRITAGTARARHRGARPGRWPRPFGRRTASCSLDVWFEVIGVVRVVQTAAAGCLQVLDPGQPLHFDEVVVQAKSPDDQICWIVPGRLR